MKKKIKENNLTKLSSEQRSQAVEELKEEAKNGKLSAKECFEKSNGFHLLESYNHEKNKGRRERHPNLNSIGCGVGAAVVAFFIGGFIGADAHENE